jgi:hypothetical protein
LPQETNDKDEYQWVHADALIPTEIAGKIMAYFAEIETAEGSD